MNPYIFYHGTDTKTPFDRFKTPVVWFDNPPRDYGEIDVELHYKWTKPFVISPSRAESYGVSEEQAAKNSHLFRKVWKGRVTPQMLEDIAKGDEITPQALENMRNLGYDLLVDDDECAALYPERIKVLRWVTRGGKVIRDYRSKPSRQRKGTTRRANTALRGMR